MVRIAFGTEAGAIHGNCQSIFRSPCVKMPMIRGKQPGPAKHVAFLDGFNGQGTSSGDIDFEYDFAAADEIKMICISAFAKNVSTCFESDVARTADDQRQMPRIQTLKDRVAFQDGFKSLCRHLLSLHRYFEWHRPPP